MLNSFSCYWFVKERRSAMVDKGRKRTSLSQIYKGIIFIMIPVLMVGAVAAVSIGRSIQKQALTVLSGNMDMQVEKLTETFNNINYCLMDNLNNNADLDLMIGENGYKKINAIVNLKNEFTEFRYYFGKDYHFFAYDVAASRIYNKTPDNIKYSDYHNINASIMQYMALCNSNEFIAANRKWNLLKVDENLQILIKVYQNKGKSIGCWILLDTIEQQFRVNDYSNNNSFMFLTQEGEVLTHQNLYDKMISDISVKAIKNKSGEIFRGYHINYYDFYKGSFSIISIIDPMDNYGDNIQILFFFILLMFIVIGVGIYLLFYIRKKLIIPIHLFMDHLINFENYDTVTSDFRFAELKQADELFQKAKQQIKELKISIYENELQKRRLEQDYLQVQIKPHFYLNCLNIIYNMAQSKRYEEIQKLSMETSKYMRTLFRNGMDFVSVREEMEHLREYLNIQEFRYSHNFTYKITEDEMILDCKILPLIIITIVENSIKHTIMKREVIHIDISVTQEFIEDEEYLKIEICDTGEGFNEAVLKTLQTGEKLTTKDGKRIGLSNMVQRLEYIYKKRAHIQFYNRLEGGARVEVVLPVHLELEEKE